jgi:integrase
MRVHLRKRKTGAEKASLYIEVYHKGARMRETLDLYVYNNPKNKLQEQENKATWELAEQIQAKKLLEVQDLKFGINRQDHSRRNFIKFYEEKMEEKRESAGNYGNWDAAFKHLKLCFGDILAMSEINIETGEKFKRFLKEKARTKSNTPLSQNSLYSYYNKFKACIRLAYKERMIRENWADFMKGFSQGETFREYLTFDEVQLLVKEKCRYPVLKNAFLFSCLTGIRWSDISRLTWGQVRYNEKRGHELIFRQQKTKKEWSIYLSQNRQ